jgi:hypothetical protein
MSTIKSKLLQLLYVLPIIIAWTFINVLISSTIGAVVFIQLITVAQWSKTTSSVIAIAIAIFIHVYIFFQPYIRLLINKGTKRT